MTQFTTPDTLQQLTDQPAKPQYIHEQHNHGCQQFFGPVTGCVFAMPGANVYQNPSSTKTMDSTGSPTVKKTDSSSKKSSSLPDVSAAKIKKAKQKKKTAARELMTFRSRGVHEQCLKLLYQQMVKDEWIEARTTCNDFIELFSGDRSEGIIYWSGKYGKGTLVCLFRLMEVEGLIEYDEVFTLPKILMGHFVDTNGQHLTNLDNGDPANEKAGREMQDYIKILKYNPARAIRKRPADDDDDDFGPKYGDAYDSYDHQDLQYHNKRGF